MLIKSISCRCGEAWCYLCCAAWNNNKKTCKCPQFTEHYLLARAVEVVERDPLEDGQTRDGAIAAAMDTLRTVCRHEHWRQHWIPAQCESCEHRMPKYIFYCTLCPLRVCRRCTANRLGARTVTRQRRPRWCRKDITVQVLLLFELKTSVAIYVLLVPRNHKETKDRLCRTHRLEELELYGCISFVQLLQKTERWTVVAWKELDRNYREGLQDSS